MVATKTQAGELQADMVDRGGWDGRPPSGAHVAVDPQSLVSRSLVAEPVEPARRLDPCPSPSGLGAILVNYAIVDVYRVERVVTR